MIFSFHSAKWRTLTTYSVLWVSTCQCEISVKYKIVALSLFINDLLEKYIYLNVKLTATYLLFLLFWNIWNFDKSNIKDYYVHVFNYLYSKYKFYMYTLRIRDVMHNVLEFSVRQIEYPIGGSSKKSRYVYFLLIVFCVILLFAINVFSVTTMVTWCHNSTIWCHNSSTIANTNRK